MNKVLKVFVCIILVIFSIGLLTAFIDYNRVYGGDSPIFSIKKIDKEKKIETYNGLFYVVERRFRSNLNEPFYESLDLSFKLLFINLNVPKSFREETLEYVLETKQLEECDSSVLYYADLDIKVYTYCIDEITLKDPVNEKTTSLFDYLSKDKSIISDIIGKISYTGLYSDDSTKKFISNDNNFAPNGISMFICNKENINDVYIAKEGTEMQKDFCTYKDDDLKFLFEIVEEEKEEEVVNNNPDEKEEVKPEKFYEDENYIYQFSEPKLDRIFITTPFVRGKEETKTPLATILQNKLLTIDELEEKGLSFEKINKDKASE